MDEFFSLRVGVLDPALAGLPLLLLDIDGVLNAYDFVPGMSIVPPDGYDDLLRFEVPSDFEGVFGFWSSLSLVSDLVGLRDSGLVEFAWLTTWEDQANRYVCPVLGFPVLPVAAGKERLSDYSWKSRAAEEALSLGRPVVWVDDVEIGPRERKVFKQSGVPHLLVKPNPEFGLLRSEVELIRSFVENPTIPVV